MEDVLILFLLLGVIVTGFFLEACRLAVVPAEPRTWASFLGALGGRLLAQWDVPWTVVRFYVWVLHALLVFRVSGLPAVQQALSRDDYAGDDCGYIVGVALPAAEIGKLRITN